MALFNLILDYINDSLSAVKVKRMTNFQKLLLTLMKLRTNATFVGLGYRFGIATHTASTVFQQTIIALEYSLSYLIHWPDRDSLGAVRPTCFKANFGNLVAVIVDCFKIRMERPSTNRAKAQTFSDYKHCNP